MTDPEDNFNPQRFSKSELNDLVRDLNLCKESSQLLGSRFQARIFWHQKNIFYGTDTEKKNYFLYSHGKVDFYWLIQEEPRSHCLMEMHMSPFLGSCSSNESSFLEHENIVKNIPYEAHKWRICGDFKVIRILLDQQARYAKKCLAFCVNGRVDQSKNIGVWELRQSGEILFLELKRFCMNHS